MEWYKVKNIEQVDSPALLIFKKRLEANIEQVKHYVQRVEQLRPHVKTHKMKQVTAMLQAAGIHKFKCATIAEAEMLGEMQARDVLISYPVIGPKVLRLKTLREKFPQTIFSCLIDNLASATYLNEIFEHNPITVFIDLNVGMNRTGIKPENASDLFQKCVSFESIKIIGLHAYDGHIHSTDLGQRTTEASEVAEMILKVKQEIAQHTDQKMQVIAGGSPTFHLHAEHDAHAEVSPGTFVFWDQGYSNILPDFDFKIAAVIATRVISIIDKNLLCVDLGHKSIAAENPLPRIQFLGIEAEPIAQSEEHLVVKVPDSEVYIVGEVLYGVPIHICPTVALYEEVRVIENNNFTESWKVFARDKSLNI
jgi:D-threonine aldolase